ncbi:MAG: DUF1566 domain-containing protein [Xanthomonadales bacterium]|nr:DUF1566 domain-containing protein [Xanthomonadales bacterium]
MRGLLAGSALCASPLMLAATCPSPALLVAPDSRFELSEPVAGEVIVRDLQTGLEWQQCPLGRSGPGCTGTATRVSWAEALTMARDSTHGGFDDWRLPNMQELYALIEWGCQLPAINLQRFPGELGGLVYWSSTTTDTAPATVYIIDSDTGGSGNAQPKTGSWSVRLVRGGDAWSSFNAAAQPDPFAFADQLAVPVDELRLSETIMISGLNGPTQASVVGDSGAAFALNGGTPGSAPQRVVNGDQIRVQHQSASTTSTTVVTTLHIGGRSAEFRSTTIPGQRIGGSVSGLLGSGLVLRLNGTEDLPIAANGSFQFSTELLSGTNYVVTVLTQPAMPAQACEVIDGSGLVPAGDVSDVQVNCQTVQFSIGGSVSGLLGSGLVLQNNGGDDLSIESNGPFSFATPLDDLSPYNVSVASQPLSPRQTCMVAQGNGALRRGWRSVRCRSAARLTMSWSVPAAARAAASHRTRRRPCRIRAARVSRSTPLPITSCSQSMAAAAAAWTGASTPPLRCWPIAPLRPSSAR